MSKIKAIYKVLFLTIISNAVFGNNNQEMAHKLLENNRLENKSYYETLGELFESGHKPSIEKHLDVFRSGRCFLNYDPNTPMNGAFMYRKWFPNPKVQYYATINIQKNKPANYFDIFYFDEFWIQHQDSISFQPVKNAEREHVVTFGNYQGRIREWGDYIIEEFAVIKEGGDLGPIGNNTLEPWLRCYFFISEFILK